MKIDDVYAPGIIAFVEQFTYAVEELRQYVIYTYYDKEQKPLYVGRSRDFYNAHHINGNTKEFMKDVVYIGFIVMENEEEIKEAVKLIISFRKPIYNKKQYKVDVELSLLDNDIFLLKEQMEKRWREFLR